MKNFFRGLKNLWLWLPIVWKDRQWDYYYVFRVFRHKLHLTEQFVRNHGHHINNVKDADRMLVCIRLLDRLMEDKYDQRALSPYYKKWGPPQIHFNEGKLEITHVNVITEKDKRRLQREFREAIGRGARQRVNDMKYLSHLLVKHVWSWWD